MGRQLMETVSFSNECARGEHTGREEGELVMRCRDGELCWDQALSVRGALPRCEGCTVKSIGRRLKHASSEYGRSYASSLIDAFSYR